MKTLLIFLALFFACINITWTDVRKETEVITSTPALIDDRPGSCAYFTKDHQGNLVLSWVRALSDSSSILCYSMSKDEGKSFSKPIEISTTTNVHAHAENVPKLAFKSSGEVIAVWGSHSTSERNPYAGNVYYSQSFDEGKTWTTATPLVTDTAGYDQRYFDVDLMADGEVAIIWLDNRKKKGTEGSSLYFAKTDGKNGFRNEKILFESCCHCCRTDLYIDPLNTIHVLYRSIIADSIRDIVHAASRDQGKTFSAPRRISNDNWVLKGCPHTGPSMTSNNAGLHLAWFTGGRKKGSFYTSTKNNGTSFSGEDSISSLAKHPQIGRMQNETLLTVWDEVIRKDSLFTTRIGMQLRSAGGKPILRDFISPEELTASYPVLTNTGDNAAVIAYCISRSNKKYVAYQRIQLRN